MSDTGEVRGVDRYIKTDIRHVKNRLMKGRTLTQNTRRNGYKTVDLCKNGKVTTTLVHRIVANAFIPNPDGLRFVNHRDSDRSNNAVSNLEWVTSSENRLHGLAQGNVVFPIKAVKCIEIDRVFDRPMNAARWVIEHFPERCNGKAYTAAGNIRAACKGRKHTVYGFTWEYSEGSTTIPEGSRAKRPEMGGPSQEGEDIV